MPNQRQSLSQRTSMLGPDLALQKMRKDGLANINVSYDEGSPRKTFTSPGGAYIVNPGSTPIVSSGNLLTQTGNTLITQAGNNIITN